MAVNNDKAPIIIKRKKIIKGGGHHGGAWKVAYADFVTAMMAFFLLMWLLGATTEDQRKGIADYFNPTIPIHQVSGGGTGAFSGGSLFSQDVLPDEGTGATSTFTSDANRADGDTGVTISDMVGGEEGDVELKFTDIENMFRGDSGESTVADDLLKHVFTRVTDEGLIIEIFDLESSPLFVKGTDIPNQKMVLLLGMVADVTGFVSNEIAVSGHTDTYAKDGNDSFVLSARRAEVSRQQLLSAGVPATRIARVTGNADRAPSSKTASIFRNRRIEITLLRR
ncbi:MAG: flagellar motor protein MotB [Paracoccaceae bacterium]